MHNKQITSPSSPQAEQSVLGSLIIDNSQIGQVMKQLAAEDFVETTHQAAFRIMERLHKQGLPIDLTTLPNTDNDSGIPTHLLVAELAEIAKVTPTSKNILSYVNIVKEHSGARKIIGILDHASRQIQAKPYNLTTILADTTTQLAQLGTSQKNFKIHSAHW